MDKSKLNKVELDLIAGLEEFARDLQADGAIPEKYTCRRVILNLQPRAYTPAQVKLTRDLLKTSQALFAQFLGVSPKTIAAWECGSKKPQEVACRLMDEIQRDPNYWRRRLSDLMLSKPVAS